MSDTRKQTAILFAINGLPYRAEPLILLAGEQIIRIDEALERCAGTHANKEDIDNFCQHPDQVPAELRGHILVTHFTNQNGNNYYLYARIRPNGTVMQDFLEDNHRCSPRYVRILTRGNHLG